MSEMDDSTDRRPVPPPLDPSAAEPTDRLSPRGGRWRGALRGSRLALALGVLVLPLTLAVGLTVLAKAPTDPAVARVVSTATLESEFGVHFDLVGVTAAGGLVEIRFTVLDAAKARMLFHDPSAQPTLFVADRGAVLRMKKGMSHALDLVGGARYFFLFPNANGVVQSGTPVSIVIDDIRLEPIAAQS